MRSHFGDVLPKATFSSNRNYMWHVMIRLSFGLQGKRLFLSLALLLPRTGSFFDTHTHMSRLLSRVLAKITSKRHVTTSTHTLRFGTWSVVSADVLVITWRTARYLEQRSIDSLSFHFFLPEIYFLCGVYFFSLPQMFESRVDHNHDLWTQHHTSYQAVAPLPAEASWSASTTSERQTTSSLGEESLGKVSQRSHQEILGDPARSEGSQEEQWKPQEVHRYAQTPEGQIQSWKSLAECGLLRKPEQLPAVWFWVGSSLCLQRNNVVKQCKEMTCRYRCNMMQGAHWLGSTSRAPLSPQKLHTALLMYCSDQTSAPPSPGKVAKVIGTTWKPVARVFKPLHDMEAAAGEDLNEKLVLRNHVEMDATTVRTCQISPRSRTYASLVSCLAAKVPEKTAAQLLSLTHPHSWSLATWHQQSQAGPLQMEVDVSLWQTSTGILWWNFYQSHIGIHSSSDILLHWWCSRMEESWKRLASQTFEMGGGQAFPCRVCAQKTSRSHCGDTAVGSAVAACKEKCATPVDNNFQREGQRESSLEVSLAWTVASSERRPCVRQPRQVMQTKPTRKIEKKRKKKGVEWATHANTLKKTVNLKEKRHLRRAYQSFCASWQLNYKCYMLETLGFYTFRPKILLMLILQIANITALLRALWPFLISNYQHISLRFIASSIINPYHNSS